MRPIEPCQVKETRQIWGTIGLHFVRFMIDWEIIAGRIELIVRDGDIDPAVAGQ